MLAPPSLHGQLGLVFRVAAFRLALPAEAVREVLPLPLLERPPLSPPVMAGLLDRGGVGIPVLRLARLLALPDRPPGLYSPLLVLAPPAPRAALLVDRVDGLTPLDRSTRPAPDLPSSLNDLVLGLIAHEEQVVPLLAPDRLLSAAEEALLAGFGEAAARRLEDWTAEGVPS